MNEQHDPDEEMMRAKLFASMKKKTMPTTLDGKKAPGPADPKPNKADNIFIKSFDQIMREKKANDNAGGSSDEQVGKEKGLNRKRAIDLKNRQRELVLARKQAKVVAAASSHAALGTVSGSEEKVTALRARRAGQPLGIRARPDKVPANDMTTAASSTSAAVKPVTSTPNTSQSRSPPALRSTTSPKSVPDLSATSLMLSVFPPTSAISNEPAVSPSNGTKQPFEQYLKALKREIGLANKIIEEFARMDIPEFSDLNLYIVHDDDQKFIENMSNFLAGTVS